MILRFYNFLKVGFTSRFLKSVCQTASNLELVRVGKDYGSYEVPAEIGSNPGLGWMVGGGENLDLDSFLVKNSWKILVIDPTPKALEYSEKVFKGVENVTIIPKGLWSETGKVKFYQPRDPSHVSLSITSLQKTENYLELETIRGIDLMSTFEERPNLIKLDVEGAAHVILKDLISTGIFPEYFIVEFEQPSSFLVLINTLFRMRRAGYVLRYVNKFDCLFEKRITSDLVN